jgi:beta-N-acetylhexosaminidase
MTLKEKVGQLFNVRPEILSPESTGYVTKGTQAMTDTFKEYPVGGITIFAGNITNPTQLKNFTSFLHDLGNYPMLCIDEEGGRVARIAKNTQFNVPVYQSMEAIGKTGDSKNAYNAGDAIGTYLMNYGLDVDLAPVSDVNTNPNNVVIGDRAFGSDPALVADMASEFLKGLKHAKVEGCQKHFPGHGDTSTDSHYGYAESKKTWEELSVCEMLPFRKGIQADTKMIMTAHISLPNVTGDDTPSTLSKTILQEKLRGELGYKGIIITDSMGMGAITKQYSSGEAAVRAIEAGVDIILDPEDFREAFKAVMDAVEGGRISMAMIDERVTRVLELKKSILQSRGLLK